MGPAAAQDHVTQSLGDPDSYLENLHRLFTNTRATIVTLREVRVAEPFCLLADCARAAPEIPRRQAGQHCRDQAHGPDL